MAGIAKPPISIAPNLKSEGSIQILGTSTQIITGQNVSYTTLFDGIISDTTYYLLTTNPDDMNYHLDFECSYDINIYAYYTYASSASGNSINKKILLTDYNTGDVIQIGYTPNSTTNQWFKMFSNVPKGKYIIKTENIGSPNRPYITTSEWYIENIGGYFLIKQGTQYYSIKPEFYDDVTTHTFTPLTLTGSNGQPNDSDYNTFGFDDISVLTNTMTKTDVFKPIDKLGTNFDVKLYKPN